MTAKLEKVQARITEIDRCIQGLFESKVKCEIDSSLFASLKKTYNNEKQALHLLVADLLQKLNNKNKADDKVRILFTAIRKYDAIDELTLKVLADFIEHIEVGGFKSTDKKIPFAKRDNVISVFFWSVGIIKFIRGQIL